jgi:hypothetical protein
MTQIIIFIFKKYDMTTIFNLVQLTKAKRSAYQNKGGVISKAERNFASLTRIIKIKEGL